METFTIKIKAQAHMTTYAKETEAIYWISNPK